MDIPFRITLAVLFVAFVVHRGYYTHKYEANDPARLSTQMSMLAQRVMTVLIILPPVVLLFYLVAPRWLNWAALSVGDGLRWAGLGLALVGFGLLQWAQNELGRHWSDEARLQADHQLVTTGPYRWLRHPIYGAFLLILSAPLLLSANWLVGGLWIGMTCVDVTRRIWTEEALLLVRYGEVYRAYCRRTGRILPRMWGRRERG